MPKVERLPSGSYRIRYTDPWGRRAVVTRKTAADVRAAHRQIISAMARGEYVDPKRGKTTLAVWADDWLLGARNLGRGGRDMYRQALDHIVLELGAIPLGKLTATDIDRYLEGKSQAPGSTRREASAGRGLAPSTVHRHYRTLHRMLAVAVERGLIARNPCEHVQPPRIPKMQLTVLDAGQVDALAAAISPRYRAWVYLAAYGGLRWSETVGLRRRSVVGPRVAVVEQLVRRRDGTWERTQPKTGRSRTVTLPDFVSDEMAGHLDTYAMPGDDGLVFCTRNQTPLYAGSWTSNVFKRALARAGLPPIRVHDLRHTAVALAIAAGAHPKEIQARMGHSSIRTSLDLYGHLYNAADEAVAAGLDDLRAAAQRARLRAV
jgi:integrase